MKEVMKGKMEGKRGPGRKWIGMIDELMENEHYGDLKRRAKGGEFGYQGPAVRQNTDDDDGIYLKLNTFMLQCVLKTYACVSYDVEQYEFKSTLENTLLSF